MNVGIGHRARLVSASALMVVACGTGERRTAAPPVRHVVEMRGMTFSPALLGVAPGDTILFVNRDLFAHTATADSAAWDSGLIAAGDSATVVIQATGAMPYRCALHPSMRASVVGDRASRPHPPGSGLAATSAR